MIKFNIINFVTCIVLATILTLLLLVIQAPPITGFFVGILSPTIMRLLGLPIAEIVKNDEFK
mgnify:CR=1 FL=1